MASRPGKNRALVVHKEAQEQIFASPCFLSPELVRTSQKQVQTPHTSTNVASCDGATPFQPMKSKQTITKTRVKVIRPLEDISNKTKGFRTRKLVFSTPLKVPLEPVKSSSTSPTSSSSCLSLLENEVSPSSTNEREVTLSDATSMQVVQHEKPRAPIVAASTSSYDSLELHYAVTSTVSSVAIAANGLFLVAGFYNGMICLYPLQTKAANGYKRGLVLDQILPRGMYTQLMVTVSIPDDGKFIFAGVYRGSTDIRAFEVDTIQFPSDSSMTKCQLMSSPSRLTHGESDGSDEDDGGLFGVPFAKVISHTYSDAKLKGFAAAKSLYHQKKNKMEYRLLCGIGIKNVHMWRFYQKNTNNGHLEWNWECIFDKQTNGISLEFISFHSTIAHQFISKSEHQNVRIWHLEEDYNDTNDSVTIRKKSHIDVKQTVDTVAVYGDYAYGGSESLAIIDLQAAARMDLDLPLSAKEQYAQHEAALNACQANSLRAWNPRGSRRRGAEDTNGPRHMRTVSKIAGQARSPFTVGMCSDGSVFFHQPKKDIGIATPLDYIEGYEKFFADPSLNFQAQFSDLTRVNTSGLLAVLPLPATEKEEWMIVAANQDRLLVQSLEAFLHRNQQTKEYSQVNSDFQNVMRDLSGAESSTDECSSDSDDNDESITTEKHRKNHIKVKLKRSHQENASRSHETGRTMKRIRYDRSVIFRAKSFDALGEKRRKPMSSSKIELQKKSVEPKQCGVVDDDEDSDSMTSVSTPNRSTSYNDNKLSTCTASPVVSISSWSGSSNPNTPEQLGLSRMKRQVLALRETERASPHVPVAKLRLDNEQTNMESAVNAAADLAQFNSNSNQAKIKTKNVSSGKKTTHGMRAQALFTDNESTHDHTNKVKCEVTHQSGSKKKAEVAISSFTQTAIATLSTKRERTEMNKSARVQAENQHAVSSKLEKPIEADIDIGPVQPAEEKDSDLEKELERLEQYEPEFLSIPLASDGGSLLAATLYQYADPASERDGDTKMANTDNDNVAADCAAATTEQISLLLHFSHQNERLKMNFLAERERIYKYPDCSCSTHGYTKKSSTASISGVNWRRNIAQNYLKRNQLKRRQKKQLAAKLHQLHAKYAEQIQDLYAMQQMQASAFRSRQQFEHLQKQFCCQASKADRTSLSSTTLATSPLQHLVIPDHLSGASFPYPELLS